MTVALGDEQSLILPMTRLLLLLFSVSSDLFPRLLSLSILFDHKFLSTASSDETFDRIYSSITSFQSPHIDDLLSFRVFTVKKTSLWINMLPRCVFDIGKFQ